MDTKRKQVLAGAMQHCQVSMQLDLLTHGEQINKRDLTNLRISRAAWDAGTADRSIAATDWDEQVRIYTDSPDEWDWYIYLVEDERLVNDANSMLRMEPTADSINPNVLCIEHLYLSQVDTKVGQIERGELHPSHPLPTLAIRRTGWDMNRASIPATKWFDYPIKRPENDEEDWMIFTNEVVPVSLTSDHEMPLFYCIRSGMHISDIQATMNARTDELGALRLADYHIRRDQWESGQPSIAADHWNIGKLWQDRTLAVVDLDANDWTISDVSEIASASCPDGTTAADVIQMMRAFMQTDQERAWAWHCNLAMIAIDAGADRLLANQQAAQFMQNAFDVDMNANQLYRNLITDLEVEQNKRRIEAQRPEPPQHCLTLAPWVADDTLYLGKYRGYYGYYQIDWAENLINGTVSGAGRTVTTFGAVSINEAKRHFRQAVDNYITRCQTKAQAEEDLLGVVHD